MVGLHTLGILDELTETTKLTFEFVGAGACCLLLGPPGFSWCFPFAPGYKVIWRQWISIVGQLTEYAESSFLIHHGGYHDSFGCP